jgi:hypothetical protein
MTTSNIAQKHTEGVGATITSKPSTARVTTTTQPSIKANQSIKSSLQGVQASQEVPTHVGFHPDIAQMHRNHHCIRQFMPVCQK